MGFPRHWSWLPFLSPGDLSDPEIEPMSPTYPELQVNSFTAEPPEKPHGKEEGSQFLL